MTPEEWKALDERVAALERWRNDRQAKKIADNIERDIEKLGVRHTDGQAAGDSE